MFFFSYSKLKYEYLGSNIAITTYSSAFICIKLALLSAMKMRLACTYDINTKITSLSCHLFFLARSQRLCNASRLFRKAGVLFTPRYFVHDIACLYRTLLLGGSFGAMCVCELFAVCMTHKGASACIIKQKIGSCNVQ